MIELSQDFLSLEFQEQDIAVPVDAKDPAKGVVTLRFREVPFAVKKSLDLRFYSAHDSLENARVTFTKLSEGTPVTNEELDAVGSAFGSLRNAQLEVIKWSVCGHSADDFLVQGKPYPFETQDTIVAGVRYQVASPKVLRLYSLASKDSLDTAHTSLVANIAHVARSFQIGKIPTAQEVWDDAKS